MSLPSHPDTSPGVHFSLSARRSRVPNWPKPFQVAAGPCSPDARVAALPDSTTRRSRTQLPSALSQPSKEGAFACSAGETEWAGRGNTTVLRPSRGL